MKILGLFCGDHLKVINQNESNGVLRSGVALSASWKFYCKQCNRYLIADMDGCEGLNNYLMNSNQIKEYRKQITKKGFGYLLPKLEQNQIINKK